MPRSLRSTNRESVTTASTDGMNYRPSNRMMRTDDESKVCKHCGLSLPAEMIQRHIQLKHERANG